MDKQQTTSEQLDKIEEAVQAQAAQYDKAILTVSSALFALSVAFLKDVAGDDPTGVGLLVLAWAALAASIGCTLASFLTSQQALRHNRDAIINADCGKDADLQTPQWTGVLNWISFSTFIFGLVMFCIFAFVNLGS